VGVPETAIDGQSRAPARHPEEKNTLESGEAPLSKTAERIRARRRASAALDQPSQQPAMPRRKKAPVNSCDPIDGPFGTRRPLDQLARKASRLSVLPPRSTRFGSSLVLPRVHWVEPKLVAEITDLTWAADSLLRHTVYVGLREDKAATEVRREATPARWCLTLELRLWAESAPTEVAAGTTGVRAKAVTQLRDLK
jgi:hypothetical protein